MPIIVFNPLRERALERFADPQDPVEMATFGSTPIASSYYQVKVGGDAAALKGIMKALLALDDAAGDARCSTMTSSPSTPTASRPSPPICERRRGTTIEAASGLTRRGARSGRRGLCASPMPTIVTYGMGITQHSTGTANVQQIANLLLLRGNFGKPGAGICPLRGHSNVQGDRTVGITEKPDAAMLEGIERDLRLRAAARITAMTRSRRCRRSSTAARRC